jgi:hypothetical protein
LVFVMKRLALSLTIAASTFWPVLANASEYACWQVKPKPGSAPGWIAWTTPSGESYGIPDTWETERAYAELKAAGLCVDGLSSPEPAQDESEAVEPAVNEQPQSIIEQRAAATRERYGDGNKGGKSAGDDIDGIALIATVAGGAWVLLGKDKDATDEPFSMRHKPAPQPEYSHQSIVYEPSPEPAAVPAIAQSMVPAMAIAGASSPMYSSPSVTEALPALNAPIDFSVVMANRIRPTLISANPRQGKGMVVAYAYRKAKQVHNASTWLIQPKYVPQEMGYWAEVDRCFGFMAEDYLTAGQRKKDELCAQLTGFIQEWRAQQNRPTILIFDELSLMKAIFPDWYKTMLVPQILTEMSSGETDRRAFWAITQSPLCGDVGLSGGNKAPFDLLAIEAKETEEHLASICKSYSGVPKPESNAIYERSESPKKTIAYHSAVGDWHPMTAYPEFSASNQLHLEPNAYNHAQPIGLASSLEVSSLVSLVPNSVIEQVLIELTNGTSDSKIIKDVMGYKAERYAQGREILEQIKREHEV